MSKLDYYANKITESCVWLNREGALVFNDNKIKFLIAQYGIACVLDSKVFKETVEIYNQLEN